MCKSENRILDRAGPTNVLGSAPFVASALASSAGRCPQTQAANNIGNGDREDSSSSINTGSDLAETDKLTETPKGPKEQNGFLLRLIGKIEQRRPVRVPAR